MFNQQRAGRIFGHDMRPLGKTVVGADITVGKIAPLPPEYKPVADNVATRRQEDDKRRAAFLQVPRRFDQLLIIQRLDLEDILDRWRVRPRRVMGGVEEASILAERHRYFRSAWRGQGQALHPAQDPVHAALRKVQVERASDRQTGCARFADPHGATEHRLGGHSSSGVGHLLRHGLPGDPRSAQRLGQDGLGDLEVAPIPVGHRAFLESMVPVGKPDERLVERVVPPLRVERGRLDHIGRVDRDRDRLGFPDQGQPKPAEGIIRRIGVEAFCQLDHELAEVEGAVDDG